jgi:hypothetical protein
MADEYAETDADEDHPNEKAPLDKGAPGGN